MEFGCKYIIRSVYSLKFLISRRRHQSIPLLSEISGILELVNVWVFVQLIFGAHLPMNQLNKNQTLFNSRIPDTSAD